MICGSLAVTAGLLSYLLGVWAVLGVQNVPALLLVAWLLGAGLSPAIATRTVLAVADTALATATAIIALTPVLGATTSRWIRSDPAPVQPPAAVVVLSSSVQSDTALNPSGADRLIAALLWAREHHVPRLLTTTAVVRVGGRRLSTAIDQARLIELAGLDSIWTALDSVGNTHDEARRAATAMGASPANRVSVAVVTSPLHTRRACATFEHAGFRVTCVPALPRDQNTMRPTTPEDRLAAWRAYVYERLGWIEYTRRGWI